MIILGLGTNLGDRAKQLQLAVEALKNILSEIQCSPVYETPALLPEGAGSDWDKKFLNMAVCGKTALSPRPLLDEIKTIERTLGRAPRGHWGPREIDIDILAYDDHVIKEKDLIIPHAALLARDFALVPLADIAPLWVYPVPGEHQGQAARALALQITKTLVRTDIKIT